MDVRRRHRRFAPLWVYFFGLFAVAVAAALAVPARRAQRAVQRAAVRRSRSASSPSLLTVARAHRRPVSRRQGRGQGRWSDVAGAGDEAVGDEAVDDAGREVAGRAGTGGEGPQHGAAGLAVAALVRRLAGAHAGRAVGRVGVRPTGDVPRAARPPAGSRRSAAPAGRPWRRGPSAPGSTPTRRRPARGRRRAPAPGAASAARPSTRARTRAMFVSTTATSRSKANASTARAVYGPMPGRASSASRSSGTAPPWRSTIAVAASCRLRARRG